MTEKEKMLKGEIYDANYDKDLAKERDICKDKCFAYNNIPPSHHEERTKAIKEILGSTKENICIESPFWCDYGYQISAGENFYMNHGSVILDAGGVKFGDNVFIAPQCGFHTSGHPINKDERNKGLEYAYSITVGNDVWIGAGVQVMPGVTIGDNVVIGGGSVVTKDIPSGVIAVGNPCRVLRKITQADKNR